MELEPSEQELFQFLLEDSGMAAFTTGRYKLLSGCGLTANGLTLLDTSAGGGSSDALNVSICARSALIVVRKNSSRAWQVRGIAEGAEKSSVTLVGTVLNDY